MFRRIERRFIKLEDKINEQKDEVDSLRLELEAYRDYGVIFGQMYKHKDGGITFKMDCDMYRRLLYSGASFDDFDRVTYKPVVDDEDTTVSVDVDTTDVEEEIARLNRELIQARLDLVVEQAKAVPESILKQLHKTLDEMSGGHTM